MAFIRFEDGLIAERWLLPGKLSLLHKLEVVDFLPS